jgi:hypothetical protein
VPWQAWAQTPGILAKPDSRFADEQKLTFNRGNRLRVFAERLKIHLTNETCDQVDCVEDILQ